MGDDLSLPERDSLRTAMQWSPEPHGGFSKAKKSRLRVSVISSGAFGYRKVNVSDQQRDSGSLLNWMERAIRERAECPEFGTGEWERLRAGGPSVLALRFHGTEGAAVAVHNLGASEGSVATGTGQAEGSLREPPVRSIIASIGGPRRLWLPLVPRRCVAGGQARAMTFLDL
jgi:maltose alpha-D-glucosyltransferase/alpha-amylase